MLWAQSLPAAECLNLDSAAALVADVRVGIRTVLCRMAVARHSPSAAVLLYCWLQVLNKTDLLTADQLQIATKWLQANTAATAVLPTAAISRAGIDAVQQWAVKQLPLGPTLYPKVRVFPKPCGAQFSGVTFVDQ